MKLNELLRELQNELRCTFNAYPNDNGVNYHVINKDGSKLLTIVTNGDSSLYNAYWDNPVGKMSYNSYEKIYSEYVVGLKDVGEWEVSRFSRY